jgi:hypothetical protein
MTGIARHVFAVGEAGDQFLVTTEAERGQISRADQQSALLRPDEQRDLGMEGTRRISLDEVIAASCELWWAQFGKALVDHLSIGKDHDVPTAGTPQPREGNVLECLRSECVSCQKGRVKTALGKYVKVLHSTLAPRGRSRSGLHHQSA